MIADRFGGVAADEPHRQSEAVLGQADPSWERDRLLELSGELVTVFDTSGRILSVNPAVSRSLGWNEEELQLGLNWVELLHPDDSQLTLGLLDRLLVGLPVRGHEARLRHRDGSYRLLSSNITPFLERGVIWCVSRDLTEYRAALATARAGDQRFYDLFEKSPIAISLNECGGQFVQVNRAYCELVGYTEAELLQLDYKAVTHPEDVPVQQPLIDALAMGWIPGYELEKRYVRQDGEIVWGRLRASSLVDPSGHVYHLAMVEDIGETHAAEAAQREFDGLRDAFMRIVSHDLQNPLVAIAGLADILAVRDAVRDAAEAAYLAGRIGSQARRLQRMVGSLLSLDRLYHGEEAVERAPTDLAGLVAGVVETVGLEGRPVSVDADEVVAWIDPEHVQRIVENLLINICAHTPPKTAVRVWVTAEGDDAVIVVEDDGPGVPEEMRESVFELFRTGRGDTRHGGVGLWIVRRLAVLHGGGASVEPGPNGGAAFRVWFPRHEMARD